MLHHIVKKSCYVFLHQYILKPFFFIRSPDAICNLIIENALMVHNRIKLNYYMKSMYK